MSQRNGDFRWQDSVDLRDYFNSVITANDKNYTQRFDSAEKAVASALAAADRAVQKAEMAAEKRFESVNEFRNTLADQQRNLMPRSEVEVLLKSLNEKVDGLAQRVDTIEGKGVGQREGMGLVALVAGATATAVALVSRMIK